MLYENLPIPNINIPVLTIVQIIKFVMSLATEAELAGLFVCAKEMVAKFQNIINMGWTQPKTPIQWKTPQILE